LKTIINMLLEPLLYGRSIGVSPVPLLMMIAFWTWLWGPVGLLLATPLTVCLLVFAKHVPQLDFVQVLLSDEPAMEMQVSFYQRLLAMDQAEAIEILQQYLKNHEPDLVYDELLMPALSYAKEDRRRNNLTDHEEIFLFKAMREVIEVAAADLQRCTVSGDGATASVNTDPLPRIKIIGCPAHGEADEVALLMLRQLLVSKNCSVEVLSSAALAAEVIVRVREDNPAIVCIAEVVPDGLVQVRYLSKRLRASFPDLKIVIGRWGLRELGEDGGSPTDDLGVVGSTLLQTRDQITNLRQLISDVDTKTGTEMLPAN
jgi:hypothetical protein